MSDFEDHLVAGVEFGGGGTSYFQYTSERLVSTRLG